MCRKNGVIDRAPFHTSSSHVNSSRMVFRYGSILLCDGQWGQEKTPLAVRHKFSLNSHLKELVFIASLLSGMGFK